MQELCSIRTAEPGLRDGIAERERRAAAEDTQLLGARRPQPPDRRASCSYLKARQDTSSVTTRARGAPRLPG